jgi:hypothetical protein
MRSFRMAASAAVYLVSVAAVAAQAQSAQHIPPGKLLRPTTDTIAVTVEVQGRSIPFATAFHRLRHTTRNNQAAWELTYRWLGNDGSVTADTLWVDAMTLAPIENHRHNGLQDGVTKFSGASAHTRYVAKGKPKQHADTTVQGLLHASGELEELIRASPLAVGYRAAYTLYYGPPGQLARHATFRVVRSQVVSGREGKAVDCWVVDAPLSAGLNTFFVSKADHRVVRLENHEDPSATFVFLR